MTNASREPLAPEPSAAEQIDGRIRELADWRGEMLARLRSLIHEAVPDVVESWKWRGVPVWEKAAFCAPEKPGRPR